MKGLRVVRNDGVTLSEEWDDCPNAYNGVMFPGFPNLFILLGPNTILGKLFFTLLLLFFFLLLIDTREVASTALLNFL